jgi:hypothetical protein
MPHYTPNSRAPDVSRVFNRKYARRKMREGYIVYKGPPAPEPYELAPDVRPIILVGPTSLDAALAQGMHNALVGYLQRCDFTKPLKHIGLASIFFLLLPLSLFHFFSSFSSSISEANWS